MLVLTGNYKDRVFDDTQVSAADLMKMLGVPAMGKLAEFRLTERMKSKGLDGEIHHSKSFGYVAVYKVETEDGTLQVRYAERKEGAKDKPTYFPYHVNDFRGEAIMFTKGQKLELYCWFYLHPEHRDNPYRNQRKNATFYLHDPEKVAQARLAVSALRGEVNQQIMNMDEQSLRVMAKGLAYLVDQRQVVVPRTTEAGVNELRDTLISLLFRDGQPFIDAWKSSTGTLTGMLHHAIDSGLITLKDEGFAQFYQWTSGAREGSTIVQVRKGENPFDALKATFIDNHSELTPLLHTEINRLRLAGNNLKEDIVLASNDEMTLSYLNTLSSDEILDLSIKHDIIGVDRATAGVTWVSEGALVGVEAPFFKATKVATWKTELAAALKTKEMRQVQRSMAVRIHNHLKPEAAPQEEEVAETDKKD